MYRKIGTAALLVACSLVAVPVTASAVTITIRNNDLPGKGFNDPSPVQPVGGNPGRSLGAQRLFLFQYAADIWSERLGGNVPIVVSASFSQQGGTSVSAVLGFARPTTVHDDFTNAPKPSTWYVAALANQRIGIDLNDLLPGECPIALAGNHCPEIEANFNSDVDGPVVLGLHDFYYGVDGNNGIDIDFLSVLLHEIGHGLGFLTLVDPNGVKFNGEDDPYLSLLEDMLLTPRKLSAMTDTQRKIALRADGNLVFTGAATLAAAGGLAAGRRVDGALKVFAPSIYQLGSSVSHVDTVASPNELMEPYLSDPQPHNLDITVAMLADMGWTEHANAVCGDANGDGSVSTSDALMVLRGAVGNGACPLAVCNVNNFGGVTTADALLVLRRSVGQPVSLTCPQA
ncbi:MAG TPA: hypothetical protein VN634_18725 [Candidatus Limnocylindrales bacterium]|nr:hypothetical protein [Candidatus Limnocylindrales bacterium]